MIERKYVTEWINRSMPAVLVAFLWLGLWKMWPEQEPSRWIPEKKPFRISLIESAQALDLVNDPTVFAFESAASFQPEQIQALQLLRMPGMSGGRREFLDMSGQAMQSRANGERVDYSVWEKMETKYEGVWPRENLFNAGSPKQQLVIIPSGNLVDINFRLPDFTDAELKDLIAGWEVQLIVDVDKTGLPVHVLVEKGSGNRDIDQLISRKALLGRADMKKARNGRVTVSYGME